MKKFEELYKKYQNGTATREERTYVEEELKRAQEVSETLGEVPQIAKASDNDVAKIKKTFRLKTLIVSLVIAVVSIAVIVGVVLGIVFGVSVPAARQNRNSEYDRAYAIYKVEEYHLSNVAKYGAFVRFDDGVDFDFEIESPLKDSYYKWELEVITDLGIEVTYHVSTKDGSVVLAHVDY